MDRKISAYISFNAYISLYKTQWVRPVAKKISAYIAIQKISAYIAIQKISAYIAIQKD